MGYFDQAENVEDYIRMAEGYDGKDLVAKLGALLPADSTVLEIGMGPGKDLDLLRRRYTATGSDASQVFVDRYTREHPDADVLCLDAITLETERCFSGVYSNKVLHHLTRQEMQASLRRQFELLDVGGIALHSLWHGDGEEEIDGLRFVYYSLEEARERASQDFGIIEISTYGELEEDDSVCLILRKS